MKTFNTQGHGSEVSPDNTVVDDAILDQIDDDEKFLQAINDPASLLDGDDGDELYYEDDPPERPHGTPAQTDTDDHAGSESQADHPWLINPSTGKPYDNGMYLGKYTTYDEAVDAVPHMMSLIGRKSLPHDGASGTDAAEPLWKPKHDAVSLSDKDREMVEKHAFQHALRQHARDIEAEGLSLDDITGAEDLRASRWLYDAVRSTQRELENDSVSFLSERAKVIEQVPERTIDAVESGFDAYVSEITQRAGMEPDQDDMAVLRQSYDDVVNDVLDTAKKIDDYRSRNEGFNPFEDPGATRFFDKFFRFEHGVPILDEHKVLAEVRSRNTSLIDEAISTATMERVSQGYSEQLHRGAPVEPFPLSLGDIDEGVTGAHRPVLGWDELQQDDIIDQLEDVFDGDTNRAMEFYQASVDHWDNVQRGVTPVSGDAPLY